MKHKGLHTHRLKDNPEEKRFAEAWDKVNEQGKTLDHILDNRAVHQGLPPSASHRDEVVAATTIQWLGSPVGQNFLRDLGYSRSRAPSNLKWHIEASEVLARHEKGIDWGRPRKLVARAGGKLLFWIPGHTGWVSRGQNGYHEGTLIALDSTERSGVGALGTRLAEGGHLTRHLQSLQIRQKIADFFDCEVWDLPTFRQRGTYVRKKP